MQAIGVVDGKRSDALYRLDSLVLFRHRNDVLLEADQLVVRRGTFVCITGPSGAGKSSLLAAMAGLNRSCEGRLSFEEHDLLALNHRALAALRRERIGLVFQHFHLFDELSASANASMQSHWCRRPERHRVRQHAAELLASLGLPSSDVPGARLSGGEQQRVAVARALATNADVLLADEPTASLDRATGRELIELLLSRTVHRGSTLVACTHDEALMRRADELWVIENGGVRCLPASTMSAAGGPAPC